MQIELNAKPESELERQVAHIMSHQASGLSDWVRTISVHLLACRSREPMCCVLHNRLTLRLTVCAAGSGEVSQASAGVVGRR